MLCSIYLTLKNLGRKSDTKMGIINVINDRLFINNKEVNSLDNPLKKYSEGKNTQDFIIMHFTASTTVESAHNNYLDPKTQVSWHLTIDREGNITQLLPFDKIAWHAGKSYWKTSGKEYNGLNAFSIGIELVNAGQLTELGGRYVTWSKQVVPNVDIFFDKNGNPWQKFTEKQIQSSKILTIALAKILNVKDILSHEMISAGRKQDTGPAFVQTLNEIRNIYHSS